MCAPPRVPHGLLWLLISDHYASTFLPRLLLPAKSFQASAPSLFLPFLRFYPFFSPMVVSVWKVHLDFWRFTLLFHRFSSPTLTLFSIFESSSSLSCVAFLWREVEGFGFRFAKKDYFDLRWLSVFDYFFVFLFDDVWMKKICQNQLSLNNDKEVSSWSLFNSL